MRAKLLISAVATLAAFTPALADEGMWTFDNFPSQTVQQKYGVTIDQPWLDRVRAGAVRLAGGCSASPSGRDGGAANASPGSINRVLAAMPDASRWMDRRRMQLASYVAVQVSNTV